MDYPVCNHLLDTLSKRTRGARNQSVSKHGNITGIVIAIYFNHIHEITIKIRVTYNLQEPPLIQRHKTNTNKPYPPQQERSSARFLVGNRKLKTLTRP